MPQQRSPVIEPALVAGFGSTLVVWLVWWLSHLPGVHTPTPMAVVLLTAAQVLSLIALARLAPNPLLTGLIGGGIGGVLNLLILGSALTVQPDSTAQMVDAANKFRDNAPAIMLGYTALTLAGGAVAGLLARGVRTNAPALDPGVWLARFAVVVVVAFFPLLAVGGAVTGTESGMSVPDGVTSYGAFSALLPMSIMSHPRIFLEHTHRLFGTLLGLTTITLALFAFARERRLAPRIYAAVLLVLVVIQGVFGALRVGESIHALAVVHGVFAQMVLAFAAVTACKLSNLDRHPPATYDPETAAVSKKTERMTHIAAWVLLIQLIFGAMARHSENSTHAVISHAGFSIVVVAAVVVAAAFLLKADRVSETGRLLRRIGRALLIVVFVQFLLGGLTLWQVGMSGQTRPIPTADQLDTAPAIDVTEALITTAHQTTGAGLFALVAVSVFWSKNTRKRALGGAKRAAPATD